MNCAVGGANGPLGVADAFTAFEAAAILGVVLDAFTVFGTTGLGRETGIILLLLKRGAVGAGGICCIFAAVIAGGSKICA
jgi:hypothetical protein